MNGACRCPSGETDSGDGQGCLACRNGAECPPGDACVSFACAAGACVRTRTDCDDDQGVCTTKTCDPATGCVFTPIDCGDGNVCTTDTCASATGCQHSPVSNTVPCDDGNACTQTDTCQGGVCTGDNPIQCDPPDQCHDPGVCNTETGACDYQPKSDGTTCVGEDKCLSVYLCQAGLCSGSEPVTCPDPDECHDAGVCNPATGECDYANKPDNSPCDNSTLCDGHEACLSGVCTPGVEVICPPPGPCQQLGVCNPTTGECEYESLDDGTLCDTGNACEGDGACQAGACVGQQLDCDDGNACTTDTCDPDSGCQHSPVNCDDGNECTTNGCDSNTGQCVHTNQDGVPCSDANGRPSICNNGMCILRI